MNLIEATLTLCALSILWGYALIADTPDTIMDLIAFGL